MLSPEITNAHERVQRTLSDTFNELLAEIRVGMNAVDIAKLGAEKLQAAGFNDSWDMKTAPLRVYRNDDTRANIHAVPYAVYDKAALVDGDLLTIVSRPVKDGIKAFGVVSRFIAADGNHSELPASTNTDANQASVFDAYKQIPQMVMGMDPDTRASTVTDIITEHLAQLGIKVAPKKRVGYPLGNLSLYSKIHDQVEAEKPMAALAPFYLTVPIVIDTGKGPAVYRQGQSFAVRNGAIQRLIRR